MSPSVLRSSTATETFENDLNLSIVGLGVQYPPFSNGPEALEVLARKFYPESNAMTKVLSINRFTGIEKRSAIGTVDHPSVNGPNAPTIAELNALFMEHGVSLSVAACKKAMEEWGGSSDDITHMVSTTCTNSANPGYDHFVARDLGLSTSLEKVLLHGIGCSGGLAAIRTAANLALGMTARRRPARILVLACELSSVLVRSEMDSITENNEVRIGVCLFSDGASACVVSNGIGASEGETVGSVYDIKGWKHELLADSAHDLGFDVSPSGWKVVLSPRVPSLTSAALPSAFESLASAVPSLPSSFASDFDWALHPGGSTIIQGVQNVMNLTEDHLLASFEVYVEHGNSSSATIMSVMDHMRKQNRKTRREVVAAAFGPGITLELMVLTRGKKGGMKSGLSNGDELQWNGANDSESIMNGSSTTNEDHAANETSETNVFLPVTNGDLPMHESGDAEISRNNSNTVDEGGSTNGANGMAKLYCTDGLRLPEETRVPGDTHSQSGGDGIKVCIEGLLTEDVD